MSNTMRSVVYVGPEHLELRQVPIPVPQAGELLVKVRAALTCGTDVKTYRRGHPKFPPPFAFGHEFGGDVVGVGKEVQEFRPGDPVTANVFAECGECFYCRKGQGNLCENLVYNFGAFSEFMIIPKSIVRLNTFKIPSSISYAQAAVLEPLVTVVHGQARIAIQPGESVALIGAGGPISLLHLQLARRAGASQLIAIGHSPTRLEIASSLGATDTINANEQDTVQAVRDLTGGYGADVVIECAGTKLAWETAFDSARKGGRVLWFGGLSGGARIELDAARVHYGEICMFGIHGGTHADARRAFDLIVSGAINVQALLSGVMPLEDIETALQKTIRGEVIKLIIDPELTSP
ncbi:MAG: zinc-binding dehydrogenase [Anaerolineales bacterium]